MAETSKNSGEASKNSGELRQIPSRLQRRAPASIEVKLGSDWNIAIPLLSPLVVTSPPPLFDDRTVEIPKEELGVDRQPSINQKPNFRSWQHPAAPFYAEPAPAMPQFVPQCT
ncbi:uncharacterized protein At4g14450, chloroplastic-like [Tasmannia lanceolata]|uniref:uncharacterized protein At4g14450, chloroplastic-like n=1 Tax=Tasmannia lanceolata TaxID=3420 RepID=UPI004064054A